MTVLEVYLANRVQPAGQTPAIPLVRLVADRPKTIVKVSVATSDVASSWIRSYGTDQSPAVRQALPIIRPLASHRGTVWYISAAYAQAAKVWLAAFA